MLDKHSNCSGEITGDEQLLGLMLRILTAIGIMGSRQEGYSPCIFSGLNISSLLSSCKLFHVNKDYGAEVTTKDFEKMYELPWQRQIKWKNQGYHGYSCTKRRGLRSLIDKQAYTLRLMQSSL